MDEVVKYNPNNKLANEKLAAINKALNDPNEQPCSVIQP